MLRSSQDQENQKTACPLNSTKTTAVQDASRNPIL